jgi:Resolvase, N terminal domain
LFRLKPIFQKLPYALSHCAYEKGSKGMPEPRAFKLRQTENRPNHYTEALPKIDRKRATGVLVRQSRTGADTAQGESRETQLGLQDYGKLLYDEEEPLVKLYDEGAGVSGQKRIDEREKLDELYRDMHKGIIGQVVIAREDRLFRNKHMDQVGVFTKLAEEKKIKVIVPPISSASTEERTRVYDFSSYRDLVAFQDKMREAYGYIEGHVKYMNLCKQNKADKGGFDGRGLPPGFAVKGKKQDQEIVIYEPWAKEMRKLALRAQALSWNMGKLTREVAAKAYLFPEIPEEDQERYILKTNVHHIPGIGYKPRDPYTLKDWLKNVMYIGWWQPNLNRPDTIIDHHLPILDYELFAEGYAALTGYTLEGEPVERNRSITRLKETRETPVELLLHGKLQVQSPKPGLKAYITPDADGGKAYYVGICSMDADMKKDKFLHLAAEPFDTIVISRLKALEAADKNIQEKVKVALEQLHAQQADDFVSIHEQLEAIQKQLLENAKKRMKTSMDDPMYDMLEGEKDDLMQDSTIRSTPSGCPPA